MKLPPYTIFPTITGDKVSLRGVQTDDLVNLIDISFYDGVQAATLEEAMTMQTKINTDYEKGNSIHWCIVDNLTNTIVGTCGYYRGMDTGTGELGCILLPQFRGQGYMSCAMLLAIDFGLKQIGLKRIRAVTSLHNLDAVKLLERIDFVKTADLDGHEIEYELRQFV